MKVVLFCGGLGLRLREYTDDIPKPMVPVGSRPILWHLMKYYAHYGHKDFILCLGYRGDVIKQYFLKYDECLSNDFVLSGGSRDVTLYGDGAATLRGDIGDDLLGGVFAAGIVHRHRVPGLRAMPRHRRADAPPSAGHDQHSPARI